MPAAANKGVDPGRVAAERVCGVHVSRPNRATWELSKLDIATPNNHSIVDIMGS